MNYIVDIKKKIKIIKKLISYPLQNNQIDLRYLKSYFTPSGSPPPRGHD